MDFKLTFCELMGWANLARDKVAVVCTEHDNEILFY